MSKEGRRMRIAHSLYLLILVEQIAILMYIQDKDF